MKKYVRQYVIGALLLTSLLSAHAQDMKLSVGEAVKMAMENNKLLHAQKYQEQFAKEATKESAGRLLPSVSAHGSYSYFFDRQVIFMPGSFSGNESEPVIDVAVGGKNAFNTYLSLQQPILAEAVRRQVKNAKLNESIEQLRTSDQKAALELDVTSQYYTILLLRESINLNKQSLDRNLRSLEDSRSLLRQGKGLKIDTLSNYIAVENLRTSISFLETQYNIAMMELKRTVGIPNTKSLAFTDSLSIDDQRNLAAAGNIDEQSLANRPDIRQQELAVELRKNQISENRSLRLPTLYLVGLYQLQAQADDRKLDSYNWPATSFVGLQANVPIFSGMRTNAKIKQSTIHYQRSKLLLADANERAKTEVISLQNKLEEYLRRHSTAEKTVKAADLNYKIVSDRYRNGLSTRLDLADAELSVTEARLSELHSIYNVKITRLQLDKALGLLNY